MISTPAAKPITGDDYIATILAGDADRKARAAFLELAMSLAAPGAGIFDFGAGPGIDAKHYADNGFRVLTYDLDPAMRRCLLSHCREQITRGLVVPCDEHPGTGTDGVGRFAQARGIELVTANFAPFNLVTEPREEFRKFHQLISPHGKLLLSVLNPYFLGDMKYGWWWRNALRLLLRGEYSLPGGSGLIYRRSPYRFRQLAEPYFSLQAVIRGLPGNLYRRGPLPPQHLVTSQYLFLLFDKRP